MTGGIGCGASKGLILSHDSQATVDADPLLIVYADITGSDPAMLPPMVGQVRPVTSAHLDAARG